MDTLNIGDRAKHACRLAAQRLQEAGVPTEGLARLDPASKRLLLFTRPARMQPLGSVWRLGALLLDTEGGLHTVGRITRSAERGRPGYQSLSQEERRELAAAALRGGYRIGTTVNFETRPIVLDAGGPGDSVDSAAQAPVGLHGGELRVRWRAGASLEGAPTLEQYIRERVDLLTDPPLAAS